MDPLQQHELGVRPTPPPQFGNLLENTSSSFRRPKIALSTSALSSKHEDILQFLVSDLGFNQQLPVATSVDRSAGQALSALKDKKTTPVGDVYRTARKAEFVEPMPSLRG